MAPRGRAGYGLAGGASRGEERLVRARRGGAWFVRRGWAWHGMARRGRHGNKQWMIPKSVSGS
jgi:hypothetical protein